MVVFDKCEADDWIYCGGEEIGLKSNHQYRTWRFSLGVFLPTYLSFLNNCAVVSVNFAQVFKTTNFYFQQ